LNKRCYSIMSLKEDGDEAEMLKMLSGEGVEDNEPADEDDDDDDDDDEDNEDGDEDIAAAMAAAEEEEVGEEEQLQASMTDAVAGAVDTKAAEDQDMVPEDDVGGDEADDADGEEDKDGDDDEDDGDEDEADDDGDEVAVKSEPGDDAAQNDGSAPAKQRGKPKDPDAPKRPLLPFQQFGQATRAKLIEQNPSLKGDLSGMGKALAEAWAAVPEEEKQKQQAIFDPAKAKWNDLMAEYKKTDRYRSFTKRLREWQDLREIKKMEKKEKLREGGMPKRPKSGYGMFAAKKRLEMVGKGFSLGEMGKQIGDGWSSLSSSEKDDYSSQSKKASADYEVAMFKYKRSDAYHKYLSDMASVETKQALRRLKFEYERQIPKRPPIPAALYAKDQSVKGSFTVIGKAFMALGAEEKQKYEKQSAELKDTFAKEMAAFKISADGITLVKEQAKAKKQASVRAARLRYMVNAPKRSPAAKALFQAAKKAEGETGSLVGKALEALWEKARPEERKRFEAEAAKLLEEYKTKMAEFEKSDDYKQLRKIEDAGVPKDERGKGKEKGPVLISAKAAKSAVARPASMPVEPLAMLQFFGQKRRELGQKGGVKDFAGLLANEKAALAEEHQKLCAKHKEDMAKWEKTAEGKAYTKQVNLAVKKAQTAQTKDTLKRKVATAQGEFFKDGHPKKPPAPMFLFAASDQKPPGKVAEVWNALSAEEKAKWEAEREKQNQEYNKQMEEFHKSAAYQKANKGATPSATKGAKSDKLKPPASMPKKPNSAFHIFASEKKLSLMVAGKQWTDLAKEDKDKFDKAGEAARQQYEKDVAHWGAHTPEGKLYLRKKDAEARKANDKKAKEKHLSAANAPEEPPPPKAAFRIWAEEMRIKFQKETPPVPLREQAKRLSEGWKNLDAAERKPYDEKHDVLRKEHEVKLKAYRESGAYKAYQKARGRGGGRGSKVSQLAAKEKSERDTAFADIYGKPTSSGRGRGGGGRGRGATAATAGLGADSDSDIMASDESDDSDSLGIDSD